MLREIEKEKNVKIHMTESERREVENEFCKGNYVIRRLNGERKVSRRIIQFFRGREHWFSEGA
jgi:hypothetical protein